MPLRPTKANGFGESGIGGLPELERIAQSIGGRGVTTAWAIT
jgi:hypothetical protein